MSRKKTEINPKRAENLKKLIDREKERRNGKYTQADFGHDIGQTQQNISRILNQKVPLVEETAKEIIDKFPEYRLEWLMGYDEHMTYDDWIDGICHMRDLVADCMWGVIENSLRKQGKSLKFVHRSGQHVDSAQRLRADCYYNVVDLEGKVLKKLSAREMVEFEQKIQEYCDFLTGKYL